MSKREREEKLDKIIEQLHAFNESGDDLSTFSSFIKLLLSKSQANLMDPVESVLAFRINN